jgi:hypothetical protein
VEIIRDTTVTVRADSATIKALLECDSLGQVHIRALLDWQAGERLKPPDVKVNDNILTVLSTADSLTIYLQLKDRYSESMSESERTVYVRVPAELSRWQRIQIFFGRVFMLATGLFIAVLIFIIIKSKYNGSK